MTRFSSRIRWLSLMMLAGLCLGLSHKQAIAIAPVDLIHPLQPTVSKVVDYPANQLPDSNNTDCVPLTYRYSQDTTMQTGCFVETSLGFMQRGGPLIFNGTDEAIDVSSPSYGLTPIPNQSLVIANDGAATIGANLHFYRHMNLADRYRLSNFTLNHYKQLLGSPDLDLKDSHGNLIPVNTNSMAFSSNGNWLLTESPKHSFIRVNLDTLQVTPFAASFNTQPWDYSLPIHQLAISNDGRYVALLGEGTTNLTIYDLNSCISLNKIDDLAPQSCSSYDYWPTIAQQINHFYGTRGISRIRFVDDSTISFDARFNDQPAAGTMQEQWQSAKYTLSATPAINNLGYLALGDSYTSGEGTYDYTLGTDTADNMCHVSPHAYPFVIGTQLFSQTQSVACSGAVISDVGTNDQQYRGQIKAGIPLRQHTDVNALLANFIPGNIPQNMFLAAYKPKAATVSIVGNDVGFGDIVRDCAEPHWLHNTCYGTYEDRLEVYNNINRKYKDLRTLYGRLANDSPHTTLYAVGYPYIAASGGNCAINVHMNSQEIIFAQQLVDHINSVISAAAASQGIDYLDVSQALYGHRLCETKSFNVAMNGLTSGKDAGIGNFLFLGKESFHPNAFGHQLLAETLMAKSHHFSDAMPAPVTVEPSDPSNSPDLSALPKSGRPLSTLNYDDTIASSGALGGQSVLLAVNGPKNGLAANTLYTITLDHTGSTAGVLKSDDNGSINGSVTLPDDTAAGSHTIDITGPSASDGNTTVRGSIDIVTDKDDYDGDGIPNSTDSCPGLVNSGQDEDKDAVDDACDPLISQPPLANNPPGAGQPVISIDDTQAGNTLQETQPAGPKTSNTPHTRGQPAELLAMLQPLPSSLTVLNLPANSLLRVGSDVQPSSGIHIVRLPVNKLFSQPALLLPPKLVHTKPTLKFFIRQASLQIAKWLGDNILERYGILIVGLMLLLIGPIIYAGYKTYRKPYD